MSHHEHQNTIESTKGGEKRALESREAIWKKKEGVLKKMVFKFSFKKYINNNKAITECSLLISSSYDQNWNKLADII